MSPHPSWSDLAESQPWTHMLTAETTVSTESKTYLSHRTHWLLQYFSLSACMRLPLSPLYLCLARVAPCFAFMRRWNSPFLTESSFKTDYFQGGRVGAADQ